MRGRELWNMDRVQLKKLYDQETEKLHRSLLTGVSWEDTLDQRKQIAEIAKILYKRLNPNQFGNPAETRTRNKSSDSQ